MALGLDHGQQLSRLLGANAVGTMAMSGDVWEFSELDSYETPIKDGHLADVVAGDLNNDGRKDLVFLETAKNYLDLVVIRIAPQTGAGRPLAGF